ncbi:MAG: nitrogen fixation protein FixH [Bergeyella sp.]|nr:nitrogen fixation protein FixH [Bergeyella sp.]
MKLTWGHGVIFALLSFMIFIVGMIILFPMGKQNAEMITDNYYEEELVYQDVIDAKNRADTLREKPEVSILPRGINISFPEEINNENTKFEFFLYRTNDKNLDIKKTFSLSEQNTYRIPNEILVSGSYTLKLMWKKDKKNYQRDYKVLWK